MSAEGHVASVLITNHQEFCQRICEKCVSSSSIIVQSETLCKFVNKINIFFNIDDCKYPRVILLNL